MADLTDIDDQTYETRCPICGKIYTYKINALKFDDPMIPLGYTDCPQCGQNVPHTTAYVKKDN